MSKSSNIVSYRILVKSNGNLYKLGHVMIQRFEGDIFYVPSQNGIVDSSDKNTLQKIMDHISWHKSGRVHMKIKDSQYYIFEEGKGVINKILGKKVRQEIQDIGYQEIVRDTVIDFSKLPKHEKSVDALDVVFDVGNYKKPVQFHFSMVSGREIVKSFRGEKTPVKQADRKVLENKLASDQRCLGNESGNADKLLQYGLYKYIGADLKAGRRVFVPTDSGISRS